MAIPKMGTGPSPPGYSNTRSAEVDFVTADGLAEHREAAQHWVERNVRPGWAWEQYTSGTHHTPELHALLAKDGILGAGWPTEYGGSETDPGFAGAVLDAVNDAGLYTDGLATTNMVIRTIRHVGTEEQKKNIIGGVLRGEILIALGYTEPDSGSDVAAAKTRAMRDGDEWVINGQKMFTSTAQSCSHVFVLARTNTEAPKHKGLTMFLVSTAAEGFELQPIYTLGGQRTNATFYSDLRVPDSMRIGAVDEGWRVMRVALVYERGSGGKGSAGPTLAEQVATWAMSTNRTDGQTYYDVPSNQERLARIAIDEEVARLLGMRVRWMNEIGEMPGVEGSMNKLFSTEAALRHHGELLDMLGTEGVLQPGVAGAPLEGELEHHFRSTVVGTIYGGSSEIQREIIAEGRLGLPRNRPKL
jgi:3-oxocholest-4-en-26-oyl-CoA dehydrogenase alpha subunit